MIWCRSCVTASVILLSSYFGGVAQLEFHVFDVGRSFVDDDAVVAEIHFDATHRVTGKRAAIDELHHWIVPDGLAVATALRGHCRVIEMFRP